jgi:phenylpropionate dioxygenase-like ring-hydroxylating dioxygenase large terminal subunit
MFIKNGWYIGATTSDVTTAPIQRFVCNEPIALYRTGSGQAAALADRCVHRRLPLSKGRVIGDRLQCGYHGFQYDCAGKCVMVPGQDNIPRRAAVHSYPVVEKFGWVWIWMGEARLADEANLPQMPGLDEDGWVPFRDHLHVKANYQLLVDNLIDLSHESYVHTSSIGNDSVAETPIEARREGNEVFVDRIMHDIPPPPFFAKAAKSTADVDRYQLVHFQPPCYVHVEARTVPPGSNDPNSGVRFFVLDALVPETETTTNYYWAVTRNFRLEDQEFGEWWHNAVNQIFQEDREIIEAQQQSIETDSSNLRTVDVLIDGGTVLARKVIDEAVQAEQ